MDEKRSFVDVTVMHLAWLDGCIGCVLTTVSTEVGRTRREQTFSSVLYERYLRCAVAGMLKTACEAVKNVDTAEFDDNGMGMEKEGPFVEARREQRLWHL